MKKQFETESKKILDLMINSIYTNRDIFLRELISNASDALDKRYIYELKNNEKAFDRSSFQIEILYDKEARTLEVRDKGIGMTEEDLENNLGTIAKSGSLDFKKLNKDDEISIIGQFGVGFYSAFMVADRIEVVSRAVNAQKAYKWTSQGTDGYEIEEAGEQEIGTSIKLHIKENVDEEETFDQYLDEYFIRELVQKYSNYIKYPIKMEVRKYRRKETGSDDYETEEYREVEVLNSMTPIWNKSKNEISDDDYKNFYQEQRYGFDQPLKWIHLNAEGMINYRAILYIPSKRPFDFYSKDFKRGLELYSNGVMIMEKNEDLLPEYLSFVRGVVDSEDLSLNISREILQKDRRLISIAKNIEKKVISELKAMLKEDIGKYREFFDAFGLSIKAGIYSSFGAKKEDLQDLLLFKSSKSQEPISLETYVANMLEGQEEIYYAAGASYKEIDKLPQLQKTKADGFEILYLDHEIDEFIIKLIGQYGEKKFKSVFDIEDAGDDEVEDEGDKLNKTELFTRMKDSLDGEVIEVREGKRLLDDASCLISKGEISIEMEKTLAGQVDGPQVKAEKVLEINTKHPIYAKLIEALSQNDNEKIALISSILYDQARLIAGLKLDDVVAYTQRSMKLMEI